MNKRRPSKVTSVEADCDMWISTKKRSDGSSNTGAANVRTLASMMRLKQPRAHSPLVSMEFLSDPVEVKATKQTKLNKFFKKKPASPQNESPPTINLGIQDDNVANNLDSMDSDLPIGLNSATQCNQNPPEVIPSLKTDHSPNRNIKKISPTEHGNPQRKTRWSKLSKSRASRKSSEFRETPTRPNFDDVSNSETKQSNNSTELSTASDDFVDDYILELEKISSAKSVKSQKRKRSDSESPELQKPPSRKDRTPKDTRKALHTSLEQLDPNIFGSPECDHSFHLKPSCSKSDEISERLTPVSQVHFSDFDRSQDQENQFISRTPDKDATIQKQADDFEEELKFVHKSYRRERKTQNEDSMLSDFEPMTFHFDKQQHKSKDDDHAVGNSDTQYTFHTGPNGFEDALNSEDFDISDEYSQEDGSSPLTFH